MKITAANIKNNNEVVFTWNKELTTCDYIAIGVPHDEVGNLIDELVLAGVHEGQDFREWKTDFKGVNILI